MKMVRLLLTVIAIPLFLATGWVQAAEPVAMVTDLKGAAWLVKGGQQEQLNVLSYIDQGGSIRLDNDTEITITTFSPAAVYTIAGPAKLELVGGEVHRLSGSKLVKFSLDEQKANAGRQFSVMQHERLAIAAFRMRDFGLKLLTPVNVEILNVRPVFTWSVPQEAQSFIVTLFDEADGKVVKEGIVNEPIWQLPENLFLQRKHQYSWKVRLILSSGSEMTDSGAFSIIDEARSLRILQQKPAVNASFSDRVLYAMLLESEGLEIDAADEWKLLATERPNEKLLAVHIKNY